jgi:hypothetical protein
MHQLDKDLIYSAHVRSKERGWGRGGRSQSIGASEIGMCARRTWHLKRNTPKDAIFQDSYGAVELGNLVEEFWVRAMRHTFGSRLKCAGNEQRRLPKGYISCTPRRPVPADAHEDCRCSNDRSRPNRAGSPDRSPYGLASRV